MGEHRLDVETSGADLIWSCFIPADRPLVVCGSRRARPCNTNHPTTAACNMGSMACATPTLGVARYGPVPPDRTARRSIWSHPILIGRRWF